MTTPPPAKFKAYLGNLKENVLDSTTLDTNQSLQALLAAELVQRGVLYNVNDDGGADKLLDAVISTAGKPLLDASSSALPKPLMAAASAMAGMFAESCAACLATQEQTVFSPFSIQTALTRCKDVQDNRLSGLLDLLVTTEQAKDSLLLTIAEGYFLRAAFIQPDPPQMWKRCLDVLERQSHHDATVPFEAGLPLSHLISIASKKGNEKRVSELSLKLAESFLSPQQTPSSDIKEELQKAFVTPFLPGKQQSESDCVKQARQALDNVNMDLIRDDGENLLWDKLLNCRIEWAMEQVMIDDLASDKVSAAKNRGASASLGACQEAARSQVLVKSLQEESLNKSATELRDLVLTGNLTELNPRESSAVTLRSQQSERLVDRARAVSLASRSNKPTCTEQEAGVAWNEVSEFTRPIVQRICNLSKWDVSVSLTEREKLINDFFLMLPLQSLIMTQSTLLALSCWAWMTSNQNTDQMDLTVLEFQMDTLSILLRMEQQSEREYQEENVLKSSNNEGGSRLELELECAHATVLSLVGLAHVGVPSSKSTLLTHEATRKAIGMAEKIDKYQAQQEKYGSAYVLLLMAWSGLHRGPWPFCNATQARIIIRGARAAITLASTTWARKETVLESLLLDISEADAEGGSLTGGFEKKAEGLYEKSLQQTEAGIDACVLPLLKSHCLNGLARLSLNGKYAEETSGPVTAKELAEKALVDANLVRNADSVPFYLWRAQDASGSSALFHVNVSRQLIADSLVRASRPGDAQMFLEDAVRDSPADFDAAFALGSFRLRMSLYESTDASPEEQKTAQIQLLKSAKIDSGKPGPFALLGVWYEAQNDLKRALGCYSKCLLLDPSNPVAGRGILRLKSPTEAQKLCEAATNSNSPVHGWAWQAMGVEKSMKENDNELAIVCFLQALRCRDIECPKNESFSIFFTLPNTAVVTGELSNVWAELAGCYRRVGRYAAAERSFQSAWQIEEDKLASPVLCSWAQVELELGLFEEATEKFELVLQREKDSSHAIAAYGQGSALLSLGHRDALDGKAAAAIQHVSRAISCIENTFLSEGATSSPAGCVLKLLGDLYSFGALLPPDVFTEHLDDGLTADEQSKTLLKAQASFVAKGEKAYRDATESLIAFDEDETIALRAAMLCDLGGNILLQGQVMSSAYGVAQGGSPDLTLRDVIEMNSEVKSIYDRSIDAFKDTISGSPLHGPAWCGLGCSLSATDPLLAQHALCTALTLDKMMPDSWSNLAFLFAEKEANAQSAEMLDGLTQVADSPLMWICRALLLERDAQGDSGPSEARISRAADAYRAALQVVKHPSALLGLSLTCRATVSTIPVGIEEKTSAYSKISSDLARRDSYGYMSEYIGLSSGTNLGSRVLGGVMTLEDAVGAAKASSLDQVLPSKAMHEARLNISSGMEGLERLSSPSSVLEAVPGIDIDPIKAVVGRVSSLASNSEYAADFSTETGPFDHELTPSRRIIHDPENGIAWLDLAKSLAKELLSVSSSKKKKAVKEVMESAVRAGDCAARILSDQVSDPVKVRSAPHVVANDSEEEAVMSVAVVHDIIDARDVSEALALPYWIETVEMDMLGDEVGERSPKRAMDLQRALLMDPSNAFARQALTNYS